MRATLCSRSLADARSPEFAAASASSSMFRTSGSSDMGSLAGALSFIALYASTRILYHGQDEDDLRPYILCEPRHVVTVATLIRSRIWHGCRESIDCLHNPPTLNAPGGIRARHAGYPREWPARSQGCFEHSTCHRFA